MWSHTYSELRTCKHLKQDQTTWDANIFIKHHLDTWDWETETKMKRKLKRKRLKFIYISSDWMISSFFSSVRSFYSLAIHHDCQTPTQPLKCLQLTLFSYRKKEKKKESAVSAMEFPVPRSISFRISSGTRDIQQNSRKYSIWAYNKAWSSFFSFKDSVLTIKHHDSTFDYNGTMERLAPKMEFGTDESVFMDESNGKKLKGKMNVGVNQIFHRCCTHKSDVLGAWIFLISNT